MNIDVDLGNEKGQEVGDNQEAEVSLQNEEDLEVGREESVMKRNMIIQNFYVQETNFLVQNSLVMLKEEEIGSRLREKWPKGKRC